MKKSYFSQLFIILLFITLLASCGKNEKVSSLPFPDENNPWRQIRKDRIEKLLPIAMQRSNVDSWIVICRENNNDPLAFHIGGENSGGTAAFLYFLKGDNVKSIAVSPEGEADALAETNVADTVIKIERGYNIWEKVKDILEFENPNKIAINSSQYSIADGLSYTQKNELVLGLGKKLSEKFVSSTDLVNEWLSVKLPAEIEIMKKAAEITSNLQYEAYKTVVPGVTKDSDVAKYLKKRMAELGVKDGWAADQNPNVNSGPDRGHSHATEKVIMPGDVIQTDFGIKVFDIWVTDIQRFAYVLKPGETDAPDEIQKYWKNSIKGHRKVLASMKPGITGWEVDKTQRDWMNEVGSLPVMWGTGHPIGYWAHDAGPALSGAARSDKPIGNSARLLRPGQTFAYDGFFKWRTENDTTKTISVEEMAVVTETGAEYMTAPQEELILIKGN
ncbi:MAG: M24 family metallopeptidase [Bacteroidetes bacterium]|nr:M24 family metallopeptidase [Bacteroidota bacterium]